MKNIQLINPKQAANLLSQWDDSFIQVLTKDKPVVLANKTSFNAEQVKGLQIEIKMGSAYKIDLASYPDDVILELRDLNWGVLLLINNTEYLLRVYRTATEKEFSQMDKFPELQIIDFGSGENKHLTNINLIKKFKKLHTLNLDNCPALIDIGGLVNLPTLETLFLDRFSDEKQLKNISQLSSLKNLSQNNSSINNLNHLGNLTNLSGLYLSFCNSLSDLSGLADSTNLRTLNLNGCTSLSDLIPLAGLRNLSTLYLSECESLSDLIPLAGLTNLSTLNLNHCKSLSDLSPLAGLTKLSTLNLSSCESLSDLSPLAGLTKLSTLDLSWFKSLSDLRGLDGLRNLSTLNLFNCTSLSDLIPLAGLRNLSTLNLNSCVSLSDLIPLAGLTNMITLELYGCSSLSDLSPLAGLTKLSTLNLSSCESLSDLSPLAGLTKLSTLDMNGCSSLSDLRPLSGLTKLSTLDLSWFKSLSDLSPLSGLSNLSTLDLNFCESLSDLIPLTGLTNLSTLNLSSCESLSDLSPLAGLTNLSTLNLSCCTSLSDLRGLDELTNLSILNLSSCESLSDLIPLSGLRNLSTLDLNGCYSLSDLSPLAGLTNLSTLDLNTCKSLSDLSPISGLTKLSSLNLIICDSLIFVKHLAKLKNLIDLNLSSSGNIRDFEELINCYNLKRVYWIEKAICSYVLAGSAIKRKDFNFIEHNINDWIQDIKFSKNPIAFANEIIAASVLVTSKAQATTHLINAASQIRARGLADGEKGNAISAYVWELWADAALQLGAENFNLCFESALANLNTEREIEVLLSPMLTALADVPIQYPSAKTWALNLVSQTLLPISEQEDAARMAAPAAAVFYAGMQMPEEVLLWLKRGTHPNIPRWKDTVLLALVNYYATKNNFVKAREYTSQIELPDVKDQARILLAEAMAGTMPNEALEEFASISDLLQQLALAKKLMLEPNITNNSKGICQLLLCLEQSPTDLGNFIKTLLSQNPESKLVSAIEALFAKEPQVASTSATALLTICANPSISDFISPRVLERLKQELQETAANERLYLNKELTAQLIEKKLLPAADEKDFLEALNN